MSEAQIGANFLGGQPDHVPQASLALRSPRGAGPEDLRRLHPVLGGWRWYRDADDQSMWENLDVACVNRPSSADGQRLLTREFSDHLPALSKGPFNQLFLVSPLGGATVAPSSAAIMMAAAHLLSEIARYKPVLWATFVSGASDHPDAHLRALVEEFFSLCETSFPLAALMLLRGEEIRVLSDQPAVWG